MNAPFVEPEFVMIEADRKTTRTTLTVFGDNKVMLEGTAGSGKTTLMKHVCHQWAEDKLLHNVDLLIHLTLADPTLWSASSLEDMIPHPTSVEIRRTVATKHYLERGGKGCCFIRVHMVGRICLKRCIRLLLGARSSQRQSARSGTTTLLHLLSYHSSRSFSLSTATDHHHC